MNDRILKGSWIDAYMELCQGTEVPALYWKWTGLILLASALRRHVVMDRGVYELYPNLYIIFVGPTGAKKSTAGDFGYDKIIGQVENIVGFSGRVTSEAILKKLREMSISMDNPSILESEQSIFLYASELSSLFGGRINSKGTYSIVDFLTIVYGRGKFDEGTKGDGFHTLDNICVNLLAATTPEGINDLLNRVAIEGGFTSRTIFLYQDRSKKSVAWPRLPSNQKLGLQNLISDLRVISTLRGEIRVTSAAYNWFEAWHDNIWKKTFPSPELIQYWSRKPDQLLKLSMLLSVSYSNDLVVDERHMIEADLVLKEAEPWMIPAFMNVDRSKQSWLREHILSYIKQCGGHVSRSKLTKKFDHRVGSVKELADILGPLIVSGLVTEERDLSKRTTEYFLGKVE